jgi:hypothetical protein
MATGRCVLCVVLYMLCFVKMKRPDGGISEV